MTERSPTSSFSRPDRSHLKTIVAFVDPDLAAEIKIDAARTGATVQIIAAEALAQWHERFKKKDEQTLASLRKAIGNRVTPGPKVNPAAEKAVKPM